MLNLTNISKLADNSVAINGVIIGYLTDNDATRIIDIIHGMNSGISAPATNPAPAPEKKPTGKKAKTFKPATDFSVPYEVRKEGKSYVLGFSSRVPRDAYAVVANAVELTNGAKWDKALKGFPFKTKKAADEFTTAHTTISAADREAIRATWNKED